MIKKSFLFLSFILSFEAISQEEWMKPATITCHFSEENAFTKQIDNNFIEKSSRLAATSSIEVTYNADFPASAKAAFEYATAFWSKYLISSQTIRINATWKTLTGSTLAQTGSTRIYRNFTNAPQSNTWYPVALAEALAGRDLNEKDYEINVTFNSNVSWYYGTDAKIQAGRYDMVTVSLHEIAHGLGFTSTLELASNSTQGQYGQSSSPYIFDNFVQNASKQKLTNATIFGNPSIELKNALVSNALYFGMKNPKFQTTLPRLYAPATYRDGVSISHLDETTYPSGSANSLMSPAVKAAEANHVIGDILLNILNEMGWQISGLEGYVITETESIPEENQSIKVFPNPVEDVINIEFSEENQVKNIKIELFSISGKSLQVIDKQSVTENIFQIETKDFPDGMYFLKIQKDAKTISKKIIKR